MAQNPNQNPTQKSSPGQSGTNPQQANPQRQSGQVNPNNPNKDSQQQQQQQQRDKMGKPGGGV